MSPFPDECWMALEIIPVDNMGHTGGKCPNVHVGVLEAVQAQLSLLRFLIMTCLGVLYITVQGN